MYNNKTTAFKLGLLILLALLLGACAAPSYGPMVEDRSVQARPSERILATSPNTPVKVTDTPLQRLLLLLSLSLNLTCHQKRVSP